MSHVDTLLKYREIAKLIETKIDSYGKENVDMPIICMPFGSLDFETEGMVGFSMIVGNILAESGWTICDVGVGDETEWVVKVVNKYNV